jgi:hypothetical protein
MLSTQQLCRVAVATLVCLAVPGLAAVADAAGAPGGGVPVTEALPVELPADVAGAAAPQPLGVVTQGQACGFGTAQQCFAPPNPVTGRYLNVGAFFDLQRRTTSQHFVVKLFVPPATSRVVVRGVGYHTSRSGDVMRRVGVLKTSAAAPVLPRTEDLALLQVGNVVSAAFGTETCVEFAEADQPTLEPGEAAWLVLQFPDVAGTTGILVDDDATDENCDFLTPDSGRYWYRPDPRAVVKVDWALTAYTEPAVIKQQQDRSWTRVRTVYR